MHKAFGAELQLNAAVRGQVVHSVCERCDRATDSAKARALLLDELHMRGADSVLACSVADDLMPMIDTFLRRYPGPMREGQKEIGFLMDVGGPVVSGVMDRVDVLPDGGVLVVDLKTNRVRGPAVDEAAARYAVQLDAYAAAAARVPVFLHLVGGFAGAMFMGIDALPIGEAGGAQTAFAIGSAAGMVTLGWFVNSGVLERHPDLTVALIECNAGWLAYAMQQWDHALHSRYAEIAHRGGVLDADLKAPPSYYVRRQVKCQFMWDPAAIALRHEIGMDVLMWGNDYPHMEGAFPDSQLWVDKQFAGVPHDEIMKIVHDNAADVLGLSV